MVLLGHPLYAGGYAQGPGDPRFDEIHHLLRRYEVPLVMAGDTHDFEYYRERYHGRDGPAVIPSSAAANCARRTRSRRPGRLRGPAAGAVEPPQAC